MTHYVALDVSLRSVAICIVGDDGDITSVGLEAGVLTQHRQLLIEPGK